MFGFGGGGNNFNLFYYFVDDIGVDLDLIFGLLEYFILCYYVYWVMIFVGVEFGIRVWW